MFSSKFLTSIQLPPTGTYHILHVFSAVAAFFIFPAPTRSEKKNRQIAACESKQEIPQYLRGLQSERKFVKMKWVVVKKVENYDCSQYFWILLSSVE